MKIKSANGAFKRKSAGSSVEKSMAAAIRFRTAGGVEGRLPLEVGTFLTPLLASQLIVVEGDIPITVKNINVFTKVGVLLYYTISLFIMMGSVALT